MTDVSFAMEAKSDQLNAVDIMGLERIIKITRVNVAKGDQPISIYFEGDHNRPWKPSKGMIRILAGAWGTDSSVWAGRSAKLYFDETVIYAGKPVGGIRIKSLSDIPTKGLNFIQAISKQKREPYPVQWLDTARPAYPAAQFDKALPKMTDMMQDGSMTLQSIISKCQQTGDLSADQLDRLQLAAPIEIDDNENSGVSE